jgi:hypothetical protein
MKLWPGQVTCLLGHNGKHIYIYIYTLGVCVIL